MTWTVTDAAGNQSTCTQEVIVSDSQLPTITCPADVAVNTDNNACEATSVDLGTPTTTDNCTVASVTNDAPSTFPLGSTTVTWTLVDGAGNSATCTQVVTVSDSQLPTITCPADVTVETNQGVCVSTAVELGTPNVSDNCEIVSITNNAPETYVLGDNEVVWTATDASGNVTTCIQHVFVLDSESPIAQCPSDLTIPADAGVCSASNVQLGDLLVSDNCPNPQISNNAPSVFELGETEVIWTVTDASGNVTTCIQTITVVDEQNPVITCGEEVILYVGNSVCYLTDVELTEPVVSDNCGVTAVMVSSPEIFEIGSTTITWTAMDASGNMVSCDQVVTVLDTIAPVIGGCGSIVEFGTELNQCGATVSYDTLLYTDNCDIVSVVQLSGLSSGEFFEVGEHEVVYEFTDASGNSTVCSWIISVVDTQEPVLLCAEDIALNSSAEVCGEVVNYTLPAIQDNCPTNSIEGILINGLPSGSVFPVGLTVVEYEFTDNSGNVTSCTFEVNITDVTSPQIVCPEDIVLTDPELNGEEVNYELPEAVDNCGALVSLWEGPMTGETFQHGYTTVAFVALDNAGLSDTCSFTVLVNNPPVAVNDSIVHQDYAENTVVQVLGNDTDSDGDDITVVSADAQFGTVSIQSNGSILYTISSESYCGMDTITYAISDTYGAQDTAIVIVEVECPFAVSVPEVITPNGDGINDVMQILGIEDYPASELKIFNKRGHKIFETKGNEALWDGKSQSKMDLGNGQLPEDTYYYILDLGDGSDLIKGFIYLTY